MLSVERIPWSGRLDDVAFLSRLFDLREMPSSDNRYQTAEQDIRQHRIAWSDWPDDWVFTDERFDLLGCADDTFLNFLCEMVHPVVRPDVTASTRLVEALNDLLARDGFELTERTLLGEQPVWSARRRSAGLSPGARRVLAAQKVFDSDSIRRQLTRIEAAVDSDPDLAIGTAKELVESTCKAILHERGVRAIDAADLPKLVHLTSKELHLIPEGVSDHSDAEEALRRMLGSLSTLVGSISQLRNRFGTGHGPEPTHVGLPSRHARLTAGAATALAVFLWETHLEYPAKPQVSRG